MVKEVSIHPKTGHGGMVQVSGTGARAKEAIRILKMHDIEVMGWTITGSKGARVYTYHVPAEKWALVRAELDEIEDRMQGTLF
jgi:hypothetical protein